MKIESDDRDIYWEYISYRCYKGKAIPLSSTAGKRSFNYYPVAVIFKESSLYCQEKALIVSLKIKN